MKALAVFFVPGLQEGERLGDSATVPALKYCYELHKMRVPGLNGADNRSPWRGLIMGMTYYQREQSAKGEPAKGANAFLYYGPGEKRRLSTAAPRQPSSLRERQPPEPPASRPRR